MATSVEGQPRPELDASQVTALPMAEAPVVDPIDAATGGGLVLPIAVAIHGQGF